MRKILILFTVLFSFIQVSGQGVYPTPIYIRPNNSFGMSLNRIDPDSTAHIPTACGVPLDSTWLFSQGFTGAGQKNGKGSIYYDSCGHHVYFWDPSLKAWHIGDSSAGGGIYTADEVTLHLSGTQFQVNSAYTGQASISTIGTIISGIWNSTAITDTYIASAANWNAKLGSTLNSANIFVGNASNIATPVSMSGDASMNNAGAITLANTGVTGTTCTNCNLTYDSKGRITVAANGTAGSGGNPFADNTALVKNNADNTRQLILSAAAISTATTRTATFPNSNITVADQLSPLSQFAPTTSSQLGGVLTDETGSGVAVFSTSPALTGNPTVPNQSAHDSSTRDANTAYVDFAIGNQPVFQITPKRGLWNDGNNIIVMGNPNHFDSTVYHNLGNTSSAVNAYWKIDSIFKGLILNNLLGGSSTAQIMVHMLDSSVAQVGLGANLSISGGLLNAAGSGSTSITGTSGGAQTSSSFTFGTTTNTANTVLTIPGASNVFTFTYNPAWDFGNNSRSVNNNYLYGTAGNTSMTGTRNVAIGTTALPVNTTGSNNVALNMDALFSNTTGGDNISAGYLSLSGNVSGSFNNSIGGQSLRNNTASQNDAFGYQALSANTSGTPNDAFGFQALFSNTFAVNNAAFGNQALKNNNGNYNASFGALSLTTCISCTNNFAGGFGAGSGLIDGTDNAIGGGLALDFGQHNSYNALFGYQALALALQGNGNVIVGNSAACSILQCDGCIIFGDSALGSSFPVSIANGTKPQKNVFLAGYHFGTVNTPANMSRYDSTIAIGSGAGKTESSTDTTLYDAIIIGNIKTSRKGHFIQLGDAVTQVLNHSPGGGVNTATMIAGVAGNTSVIADEVYNTDSAAFCYYDGSAWHKMGSGSSGSSLTTVAFSNTSNANGGSISGATLTLTAADGTNAGGISQAAQTMGSGVKTFTSDMLIHGLTAGIGASSGVQNTAFGNGAMHTAGTYTGSTAIGFDAMFNATTGGIQNTAVGAGSLQNITNTANNTGVGYSTLKNNYTGTNNTAVGASADFGSGSGGFASHDVSAFGYNALNVNQGNYNSAFGSSALQSNSTGIYNLAFGIGGLSNNTTGNYNFAAGANSGNTNITGSYNFLMGPWVDVPTSSTSNYGSLDNVVIFRNLPSLTALSSTPVVGQMGIGIDPNSIAATLVLAAGTTAQAPLNIQPGTLATTPLNGDIEITSSHVYGTAGGTRYQLDQQTTANPTIYSATAAGSSITSSAGSLFGTGIGTLTIPANTLSVGQTITMHGFVTLSSAVATPGAMAINPLIGGTGWSTTYTPLSSLSNAAIEVTCYFTVLTTGSSGTVSGEIVINGNTTTSAAGNVILVNTSSLTINTTASIALDIQGSWGAYTSGDIMKGVPTFTAKIQ